MQALVAIGRLRGLSLAGGRRAAGVALGAAVAAVGLALGLALPPNAADWLWAVPAAVLALALGGVAANAGWDPTRALFAPGPDAGHTVRHVRITVALPDMPAAAPDAVHLYSNRRESDARAPVFLAQAGRDEDGVSATWLAPRTWRGHVALLIPGAGDNRFAFKWRIIQPLLDRGIAVLTVDPPGHGEFMAAPMTVANAQAAARAALDCACGLPGVRAVAAVGISFGGCQAAWLAANDARVRALALVCTPAALPPVSRATMIRETAWLGLPRNLAILRDGSLLTLAREWGRLKGAWYGESLYGMIDALDAAGCVRACGARPTLVVHGARDQAVPVADASRLFGAAEEPKALVIAPQATHVSVVLQPREMDNLAEWLLRALDGGRTLSN